MVSIKDVAKKTGYSIATISRYLNDPKLLKSSTRTTIEKVIKEIDYKPSIIARGMRKQKTRNIALLLEEINNPAYSDVLYGVEQCAKDRDYFVYVINIDRDIDKKKYHDNVLSGNNFAGVIYCCEFSKKDEKILRQDLKNDVKVAIISNELLKDKYPCIKIDNYKAGYIGTKYLIDKGHKKIALITLNKYKDQINERKRGYIDALKDNSITYNPDFIYNTDLSIEGGEEVAKRILRDVNKYSAIFCLSDYVAAGIIKFCYGNNIKVPEDISLLGFDNLMFAKVSSPPLTTINHRMKKIGFLAAKTLISLIEKNISNNILINLKPSIVERESVKDISKL